MARDEALPRDGKKLELAFVDATARLGNSLWIDEIGHPGSQRVADVTDVVVQALAALRRAGDGSQIKSMYITGHGLPGYQGVGAGVLRDITGERSLQVNPATGRLLGTAGGRLALFHGRFSNDAIVTLGGCQVALGAAGQELLKAISRALGGVPVQAADGNQTGFPGMEGNVWRCVNDVCRIVSKKHHSWWGVP
jgi:hypothetical protein